MAKKFKNITICLRNCLKKKKFSFSTIVQRTFNHTRNTTSTNYKSEQFKMLKSAKTNHHLHQPTSLHLIKLKFYIYFYRKIPKTVLCGGVRASQEKCPIEVEPKCESIPYEFSKVDFLAKEFIRYISPNFFIKLYKFNFFAIH